jgi:hypothetical protein
VLHRRARLGAEADRLVTPGDGHDLVERDGRAGQFHRLDPIRLSPVSASTSIARLRAVPSIYRKHFADCRRERQFLAAVSFLTTFVSVRTITHAIRAGRGPFRNIMPGGRHIHHMTFGIIGLLSVGYLWMLEIGTSESRRASSRATSLSYGAAAALTLDEFALWLNLEDDYWTKRGRESIDAVTVFGALLTIGVFGKDFLADLRKLGDDEEFWR